MPRKTSSESIERLTIKLPKSLATYFRNEFPHGKRSDFVAACLLRHKREQKIATLEDSLRKSTRQRQV